MCLGSSQLVVGEGLRFMLQEGQGKIYLHHFMINDIAGSSEYQSLNVRMNKE